MLRVELRFVAVAVLFVGSISTDSKAVCQARTDQDYYAVDCASGSSTGGIQEAINACLQGYGTSSKGCTVVMPEGDVLISSGITIGGLTTSTAKSGIVLRGHGSGQKASNGSTDWDLGGTTLIWGGGADGTVLTLSGVSWSRFEDFAIDGQNGTGANKAGRGILLQGCNSCSTPAQENVFENISIVDIDGTPGNGVELTGTVLVNESQGIAGQKYDDQVSETVFEHLFVANAKTAFLEDSSQATDIHLLDSTLEDYQYGLKLKDGAILTTNVDYEGSAGSSHTTISDVYVSSSAEDFTSFRDYHETPAGSSYVFDNLDRNGFRCGGSDSGNCRTSATSLYASRVLVLYDMCAGGGTACASPAGYALVHKARGPLTVQGGSFFTGGTGNAPILASLDSNFGQPDYGQSKTVSTGGNVFASPDYVWKTVGNVGVIGTDAPLTHSASIGSTGVLELWRSGLVFAGDSAGTLGSITWKDETNTDRYKLYYNSTLLKFLDGSNNVLLQLGTPAVPLQFEGTAQNGITTSLAVTDPQQPRTVTLPDRSGTVVLSNDTLSGDVVATFGANGSTVTTIADGAVEPSDIDTTNGTGSTGQCPAKASGDQFTWTDIVTPTGTATLTHKSLTDSSNVFAVSSVFSFTGPGPSTNGASSFFGPSNGLSQSTFGAVGAPVPALKLTALSCHANGAIQSSRTWTLVLQNGSSAASGIGSCVLSFSQNPCSVSGGSASYSLNDVLSLKITASTPAPSAVQVMCTAVASN